MPYFNEPNDFSKNFNKKTPFAKKTDIESISDSVTRGNIPVIEVKEEKPKKKEVFKGQSGGSGKLYSKDEQQFKAMAQANPIARLFSGIKPKSS